MKTKFKERLHSAWTSTDSMLCVGLDPAEEKLPEGLSGRPDPFFTFNRAVIDATLPWAAAYKPQFAHYAAAGRLDELGRTLAYLREVAPDRILILDAKRGDIGSTAEKYAAEAFRIYDADAVTVNPYLGGDSLEPFLRDPARGVFLLCKTSNPGSADLQDLEVRGGPPLFLEVARRAAAEWNTNANLGLVAGATWPEEIGRIREAAPELPLLVPGIGAQGGDLAATLAAGLDSEGWGLLLNSSRGILYASSGSDFAEAAGQAAKELCEAIRRERNPLRTEGRA